MEERQLMKPHKLNLSNRLAGTVTGVREVVSFDALEIVLDTEQGIMVIKGEDLHVTRLVVEKGEVDISGRVDGILYTETGDRKKGKESLLARLFQ